MTSFFQVIKDSFKTLVISPKLFLPKIFIVLLYSIPVLFLPALTIESFAFPKKELLGKIFFWIVYLFAVLLVDILVNAMYPFLVKEFFDKKDVSILRAFKNSLAKFFLVAPTIVGLELLFVAATLLLGFPLVYFILTENTAGIFFAVLALLALIFLLAVFFFLIFPILSLEKGGRIFSIKRSVFLSKKNFFSISKAALLAMLLSVSSIAFSFAIELFGREEFFAGSVLALVLFVLSRFFTVLVSAYQHVLSPVFYLETEIGVKLR